MERNNPLLIVGEVFEYQAEDKNHVLQHIGKIADQLLEFGLVAEVDLQKPTAIQAKVRRLSDPEGFERYTET